MSGAPNKHPARSESTKKRKRLPGLSNAKRKPIELSPSSAFFYFLSSILSICNFQAKIKPNEAAVRRVNKVIWTHPLAPKHMVSTVTGFSNLSGQEVKFLLHQHLCALPRNAMAVFWQSAEIASSECKVNEKVGDMELYADIFEINMKVSLAAYLVQLEEIEEKRGEYGSSITMCNELYSAAVQSIYFGKDWMKFASGRLMKTGHTVGLKRKGTSYKKNPLHATGSGKITINLITFLLHMVQAQICVIALIRNLKIDLGELAKMMESIGQAVFIDVGRNVLTELNRRRQPTDALQMIHYRASCAHGQEVLRRLKLVDNTLKNADMPVPQIDLQKGEELVGEDASSESSDGVGSANWVLQEASAPLKKELLLVKDAYGFHDLKLNPSFLRTQLQENVSWNKLYKNIAEKGTDRMLEEMQ